MEKAFPDARELPEPRSISLAVVDPNVRQYGLGGRNYAKTRELKTKSDEAKAWQDANTAPEQGGVGLIPYWPRPGTVKRLVLLPLLLAPTLAQAACHHYARWYYPWTQPRCGIAARPATRMIIPGTSRSSCRTRGRKGSSA